jgi:D-beta-D-heptose 7-phosphate kinase / D-beta-D-heptose 1-phosphate adenosyltransferase
MPADLTALFDRFHGARVLVIGDAMLDRYLRGSTDRFCQEAPVPIVAVHSVEDAAGGAANTAANFGALGAQVALLTVVGADPEARALIDCLRMRNVNTDFIVPSASRRTLSKQRLLAGSQLLLRVDDGTTGRIDSEAEEALIAGLRSQFASSDAVIISDYGYGVLTPRLIQTLAGLQAAAPRLLLCDAKDLTAYRALQPSVVKPNYAQALSILNLPDCPTDRAGVVCGASERLLDATGAATVIVTLDVDGAVVIERGRPPARVSARTLPGARAAGAGDSFLAAFTMGLIAGCDSYRAGEIGVSAASVAVRQDGTALCSLDQLAAFLASDGTRNIVDRSEIARLVEQERRAGKRIVFTNGCFDILHSGHASLLARAKTLGDLLIVGLNTDESVRRLKGPDRPINSLTDRAQVLAALSCVDFVVPFAEDSPESLIEVIRPNVFVKGGDYSRDVLPEASLVESLGGAVRILDYLEDHSTTAIIERIRSQDEAWLSLASAAAVEKTPS